MESTRSEPVLIENGLNEIYTECSFDDNCDEWQDLEHFWGEEKQRIKDVDVQITQLSSSVEEHLLHDNFLGEPERKSSFLQDDEPIKKIVRGEDVSDIPAEYAIEGFRPHELIAIGTYVDKNIIHGFQYKVRKNFTNEYIFDGQAKYLESIGLGYGKRISFEGETLNENSNFFWSDSHVHGYGFTLQTISQEDIYNIFDTKTGKIIGRVIVNAPSLTDDVVTSMTVGEKGYVEKEVEVHFSCHVIFNDTTNSQNLFVEEVPVRGKAIVVRENLHSKAKINQIFLEDFIIDSSLLIPEE